MSKYVIGIGPDGEPKLYGMENNLLESDIVGVIDDEDDGEYEEDEDDLS